MSRLGTRALVETEARRSRTKGQHLPDPAVCYLCDEPFGYRRDEHGWWRCFPRCFPRCRRRRAR